MGRFFISTQIYNQKQLDRDGFKAYFCEKMKKEGYEVKIMKKLFNKITCL